MLAALFRFSVLLEFVEAIIFGIGCLFVSCAKNRRQTRASLLPDAKNAERKEKTAPSTKTSKQTPSAYSKKSSKKTTKTLKSTKSKKKKRQVQTPSRKSSTHTSNRKSKKQKVALRAQEKPQLQLELTPAAKPKNKIVVPSVVDTESNGSAPPESKVDQKSPTKSPSAKEVDCQATSLGEYQKTEEGSRLSKMGDLTAEIRFGQQDCPPEVPVIPRAQKSDKELRNQARKAFERFRDQYKDGGKKKKEGELKEAAADPAKDADTKKVSSTTKSMKHKEISTTIDANNPPSGSVELFGGKLAKIEYKEDRLPFAAPKKPPNRTS
ncbi:hypothetical protein M3Y96_00334200 [Aphelenchoides besseyi]|nr:hypothetical protein M3Y96_00334200 [Aphelenchoides besseyi]